MDFLETSWKGYKITFAFNSSVSSIPSVFVSPASGMRFCAQTTFLIEAKGSGIAEKAVSLAKISKIFLTFPRVGIERNVKLTFLIGEIVCEASLIE